MFIWKISLILEKLKEYVPDIHADLEKIGDAMNTPAEQDVLHAVYPEIRKISVDYAVLEPAAANQDVLVIPGDFDWSDVGSWDTMGIFHPQDERGNVVIGNALVKDTGNSIVYSGQKQVVVLGAEDLVVVDVPDALLVCGRNRAQEIRQVVEELAKQGKTELI